MIVEQAKLCLKCGGVGGGHVSHCQEYHKDNINHPTHYNSGDAKCTCGRRIECIDVTRHMDFNIGNAIKYLWRFKHKNGLEDLKKARWYIDDEIKRMELKL